MPASTTVTAPPPKANDLMYDLDTADWRITMADYVGFGTTAANLPLSKLTFKRREIGKDDVKIDILFCGVCHSDLHFARNEWQFTVYPAVPGHEIVGRVAQVGSAVRGFKIGDQVGVGCLV